MRSFFWLLISGVLWLSLVQIAPLLGVPSQIISLARSGYIAIFSIYMMVELRGAQYSSKHRPSHIYLYLLPLISLFLLAKFSNDFALSPSLLFVIGCFYLCSFTMVNIRSEAGRIRQAGWDLLAPPVLFIIMLHPVITMAAGTLCILYMARLLLRPVHKESQAYLDSFIVQLPSICIAPVVLIALRDVFNGGGLIDRTHIESFGLVVNGVGAAVWTAIVMRGTVALDRTALRLWILSLVGAVIVGTMPINIVTSAGAILVAEGFRGAMWLGTTVALAKLSRGKGLTVNLVATILPLASLWIGKNFFQPSMTLLLYAGFVLPIPVVAHFIVRQRRREQGGCNLTDDMAGNFDRSSVAAVILEQKP